MRTFGIAAAMLLSLVVSVSVWGSESLTTGLFESRADIGSAQQSGLAFFDPSGKAYRLTARIAAIGGKKDAFLFVYKKLSGNFTFSADARFERDGSGSRRELALMVRQSLEAGSAFADVAVRGDGSVLLQYRPGEGVDASEFRAAMKNPSQLSISREGHEFTIDAGNAGEAPATTGPIVVTMHDPVYLGLAVSANANDVVQTATFAHVQIKKGAVR